MPCAAAACLSQWVSVEKAARERRLFWVFCHWNKISLLASFRAQCRENGVATCIPPCRAVTGWHLLFHSYLHFPAKLQDQQQRMPRNWEVLTDLCTHCCILKVSSFTFHLNYKLTDICLNQLFEYQFCSCTKGKQRGFKYSFATNINKHDRVYSKLSKTKLIFSS